MLSLSVPSPSSYIIESGVCYLVLCEASYPPNLAFGYLEEVYRSFNDQHSMEIAKASRPYHFIEFGKFLQKN